MPFVESNFFCNVVVNHDRVGLAPHIFFDVQTCPQSGVPLKSHNNQKYNSIDVQ
jgi:hypothetical protein